MKLAFIGGGTMGEAVVAALLEKKRAIPSAITVSDISAARRDHLAGQYGVITTEENLEAVAGKDIVILSVKPQHFPEVAAGIKGQVGNGQLVISIMAGVRTEKLAEALGYGVIVRAMPNTPAQIGQGVTGWTATPDVTDAQKEKARLVLGSMGEELFFPDERSLDMVTAVSGSGPAYVFLFAEALTAAAEKLGLGPDDARELVLRTLQGSVSLLGTSDKTAAELRHAVTSRGGTTERALQVFDLGGFSALVAEAVRAAYERSLELGD
jgi:pyrroline-5-carboxylate reductase